METSVNNKCRAFTSLEQSKKLAEILLIESADMYYHYTTSVVKNYHEDIPNVIQLNNHFAFFNDDIPCWSLAALLEILQYPILFHNGDKEWGCTVWIDTTKPYSISPKDTPIDACYAMILKLNELKLL